MIFSLTFLFIFLLCQLLKIRTKEVLYEKYRTEKLLARRATANISDDQRQRLLEGTVHLVCETY